MAVWSSPQVRRELILLNDLKHPNIVEGRDCWSDSDCVYIVQEYAALGEWGA